MGFAKVPTKLGFSIRNQLIIGMPKGSAWGLGLKDNIVACEEEAISGILLGFQVKESQGMGKTRLQIFLKDQETGEVDSITTGLQSSDDSFNWFSRSFIQSISCEEFDSKSPLILVPRKGKDDSPVVFCQIFQSNRSLRYDSASIDFLGVLESLAKSFPDIPLYPAEKDEQEIPKEKAYEQLQKQEKTISWDDLMTRNNLALKRLGWSHEKGRDYLKQTYGKRSRQVLSDQEFLDFTEYLESLVNSLSDPF